MSSVTSRTKKGINAAQNLAVPTLLASQILLVAIKVLDMIKPEYYPLRSRSVTIRLFVLDTDVILPMLVMMVYWLNWMLLNRRYRMSILPLVAFITIPYFGYEVALVTATIIAVIVGLFFNRDLRGLVTGSLIWLTALEAISLLHWGVLLPLGIPSPFSGIAKIEMSLFYLVARSAPVLAILLLLSWSFKLKDSSPIDRIGQEDVKRKNNVKTWKDIIVVALALLIGAASSIYPYTTTINPLGKEIGTDVDPYVNSADIIEIDPIKVLERSGGSRPLIHLLIYSYRALLNLNNYDAVTFLPALLNPMLALSAYILSMEIFGDRRISRWAVFLTASGTQIVVSMYAYFLANMLALSLVFLSFAFFFRSLRTSRLFDLVVSCVIGFMINFTHPWTLDQYVGALVLLTIFMFIRSMNNTRLIKINFIITYLTCFISSELIKSYVFRGFGSLEATTTVTRGLVGLWEFWNTSQYSFKFLYGGTLSNVVLISLGILGICFLERKNIPELFFVCLLLPSCVLYLISNASIKGRLFFNIPIGLLAANGLCKITKLSDGYFNTALSSFVIMNSLVYVFRSLANFI